VQLFFPDVWCTFVLVVYCNVVCDEFSEHAIFPHHLLLITMHSLTTLHSSTLFYTKLQHYITLHYTLGGPPVAAHHGSARRELPIRAAAALALPRS